MKLELITVTNDTVGILKNKTDKVEHPSEEIENLKQMVNICREFGGVGLSANQAGLNKSMFVMFEDGNMDYPVYVINPKIISVGKIKKSQPEGCLSVPGVKIFVSRTTEIYVVYHNGIKPIRKKLIGLNARIFQHEYSHLQGECICWIADQKIS